MPEHYSWDNRVARKSHRCCVCGRVVLPGEDYWKVAGMDGATAWSEKYCPQCVRCCQQYMAEWMGDGWDIDCVREFLVDEYPIVNAGLIAGWRYPDGAQMPPPFQPRCRSCQTFIQDGYLWCKKCDALRLNKLHKQFVAIREEFNSLGEGS